MTMTSIKQLRDELLDQISEPPQGWTEVLDIAEAALKFIACGEKITRLSADAYRLSVDAYINLRSVCQKVQL